MINIQLISTIIGVFAGLGIFVAGCGYSYSSWKAGKNKYKDEIIADLKESLTIEQQKVHKLNEEKSTLISSHQQQLTELQKEFAELKGRFEEQNKKLEEYKAILQDRDPATLEMLTEIKDGISSLNKHHVKAEQQVAEVARRLNKPKKITGSVI